MRNARSPQQDAPSSMFLIVTLMLRAGGAEGATRERRDVAAGSRRGTTRALAPFERATRRLDGVRQMRSSVPLGGNGAPKAAAQGPCRRGGALRDLLRHLEAVLVAADERDHRGGGSGSHEED